jgi:hypothetical protein
MNIPLFVTSRITASWSNPHSNNHIQAQEIKQYLLGGT